MTIFGLPEGVRFCTRCVISNQRPASALEYRHTADSPKQTIAFDDEGVCSACRAAERKATTDWTERDRELRDLCDRYRSRDGSRYDCIVPGSGGKDSFYAAHKLKYEYGMHPLTVTWAPHIYTEWGWRNFQRWIHAGFDNQLLTPNGRTHRLLTRLATENLLHPFQPFILGQKAFPQKVAAHLGIRLVFYGEPEAEYGNPLSTLGQPTRAVEFHAATSDDVYLGGVPLAQLYRDHGLTPIDVEPYAPAHPSVYERSPVEVHYAGYYMRWHPQGAYYYAQEHGGFEAAPERTPGTYSKYNSIDDRMDDLFYFTTHVKFGIGRATYDAAQEIRSGDITRDEGVALVRRFDGEWPTRFEQELFEYMSPPGFEPMTRERFFGLCDRFRPPHVWEMDSNLPLGEARWRLRKAVWR